MAPKMGLTMENMTDEVMVIHLVPMMVQWLVLKMDKPTARVTAIHLVSMTAGQMELLLLSMYDCLLKAQDQNSNYY